MDPRLYYAQWILTNLLTFHHTGYVPIKHLLHSPVGVGLGQDQLSVNLTLYIHIIISTWTWSNEIKYPTKPQYKEVVQIIDRCLIGSNCSSGDVRLVGGAIAQEGRVEVCVDGVWGTICNSGWNFASAYVVCKQLGYLHAGTSTLCTLHMWEVANYKA